MIEKIKGVSNPLTIIAIFASLAEVAATVALFALSPQLQEIFIWFVMGFPCALVAAFFLTLNYNSRAIYAPSDFKDEANYMRAFEFSKIKAGLVSVQVGMADVQAGLEIEAEKNKSDSEQNRLSQASSILNDKLEILRNNVSEIEEELNFSSYSFDSYSHTNRLMIILRKGGRSKDEIESVSEMKSALIDSGLRILMDKGFVKANNVNGRESYNLTSSGYKRISAFLLGNP